MKSLSSANASALSSVEQIPRDFLWIRPRNRSTGARVDWGAWSGVGTISASVIDPVTGGTVSRDYVGAGNLVEGSPIPLVVGLTVQTVTVRISQIADHAEDLVRTHDAKFAPVEIHRGMLSALTGELVAPAYCRFRGLVDDARIERPADGEEGVIELTIASHTQELPRRESWKRSDADQKANRDATDDFFQHAAVVGTWQIFWVND